MQRRYPRRDLASQFRALGDSRERAPGLLPVEVKKAASWSPGRPPREENGQPRRRRDHSPLTPRLSSRWKCKTLAAGPWAGRRAREENGRGTATRCPPLPRAAQPPGEFLGLCVVQPQRLRRPGPENALSGSGRRSREGHSPSSPSFLPRGLRAASN